MKGANKDECYQPFSKTALSMFKTGRTDCEASSKASKYQQYVASKVEDHPEANGNGKMTVEYYSKAFGFTGREGLALMGIHGIGNFNTIFTRNTYFWVRGAKLFNNNYYKVIPQC